MSKGKKNTKVAYFSMEFALDPAIPNYAGGLGVLATDLMRSAADLELPVIGLSLIYHQDDDPKKAFPLADYFEKCEPKVTIHIEGRAVQIQGWRYEIVGQSGHKVPIYFLDSFVPENASWDRDLTKSLYDNNQYTRLCQEAILGMGGVRFLRAMGHHDIDTFHMNEGHASFLTFERLKEEGGDEVVVKKSCAFTTHTPIPAGHDRFPYKLVNQVLGDMVPENIKKLASEPELHTTHLAMNMSRMTNGVSQKHAEVCEKMFPDHDFLAVTNGIHLASWAGEGTVTLLDQHVEGWQKIPHLLKNALELPDDAFKMAKDKNKKALVEYINHHESYLIHPTHGLEKEDYFDENTLTMTFSRRFVPYKRPLLLFKDLDRLRDIGYQKLQIIYSGVCHPGDDYCNGVMGELYSLQRQLRGQVKIAVLPDRNIHLSKILAAGSDVWLNTPEPPMEACGTSGMKAALNGNLNFSTLDGWWIEAMRMDHEAGWSTGCDCSGHDAFDCEDLYIKLEEILNLYYNDPSAWLQKCKRSMALAGYFNTHRNILEYQEKMWKK